ncbi:uncharacterized protein MKZ38_009777 [Zalerion maritima]|uniref:Aminoglycoside phosphotransferase domain-containing protein n=1 Tax=Zalerion maritima TaxID=339359 RepID=A0AAD5S628_9PEZI|nr:uncharacterized protein MKZ38_009777 [Zalerion maritima]
MTKSLPCQSQSPDPRPSTTKRPLAKRCIKAIEVVDEIVLTGNWEYLFAEAEKHHPSTVTCAANLTKWVRGVFNVVFELAFSDGSFWVARIRLWDDVDLETEMLSEIATMNVIGARSSIPVPTVYAYSCETTNPFGYPYMLMSALPGKVLERQFAFSVPTAYFFGLRKQINNEIRDQYLFGEDWPKWSASYELFTSTIPLLICPQFRRGPFPLYHRDFHFKNILIDEDYSITGILDWSGAGTVPVEQFTTYSDFMTYPLLSDEENRPIVDFRSHFLAAYRRFEQASNNGGGIPSHIFGLAFPEAVYRWDTGLPRSLGWAKRIHGPKKNAGVDNPLLFKHASAEVEAATTCPITWVGRMPYAVAGKWFMLDVEDLDFAPEGRFTCGTSRLPTLLLHAAALQPANHFSEASTLSSVMSE